METEAELIIQRRKLQDQIYDIDSKLSAIYHKQKMEKIKACPHKNISSWSPMHQGHYCHDCNSWV